MANYWVHINATGSKELEEKIEDLINSSLWKDAEEGNPFGGHVGFFGFEICHCDHGQEESCKNCRPILEDD
jgi:hypothetical protein